VCIGKERVRHGSKNFVAFQFFVGAAAGSNYSGGGDGTRLTAWKRPSTTNKAEPWVLYDERTMNDGRAASVARARSSTDQSSIDARMLYSVSFENFDWRRRQMTGLLDDCVTWETTVTDTLSRLTGRTECRTRCGIQNTTLNYIFIPEVTRTKRLSYFRQQLRHW